MGRAAVAAAVCTSGTHTDTVPVVAQEEEQQCRQEETGSLRHRRTPSVPLRVRTAAVAVDYDDDANDNVYVHVLSPSSAEPPSALPSGYAATSDSDGVHSTASSTSSEKYGFLVYAGSLLAWWMYIAWAILPGHVLKALGFEWYRAKAWATLVPAWITLSVVYVYIAYFALNFFHTPGLQHHSVITDSYGILSHGEAEGRTAKVSPSSRSVSQGNGSGLDIPALRDVWPAHTY